VSERVYVCVEKTKNIYDSPRPRAIHSPVAALIHFQPITGRLSQTSALIGQKNLLPAAELSC
jgi:hypothetical protein